MKKQIYIFLGIIAIVILGVVTQRVSEPLIPVVQEEVNIDTTASFFTKSVTELGIGIDALSGYLSISPNGKKMLFNGITEMVGAEDNFLTSVHTFVADLTTGEIQAVAGNLLSDWVDNDFLLLTEGEDAVIYDFKTGKDYRIALGGNIYRGALSPDRKWYVFSTLEGLRLLNLETSEVSILTNHQYDGAYSWFSDSKRILGYRETGQNLFVAGLGRQLAFWDIETKQFTDIPIEIAIPAIRMTEWLEQDHIARVNVGYDDGSHDYIVNLDTNVISDLGDTSGMLMGGVRVDQELGIIALVGPVYTPDGEAKNSARIYRANGKLIKEVPFELNPNSETFMQRESMQIVDDETLLYVRKLFNEKGMQATDIVRLDFATGIETVLFSGTTIKQIGLMPDRITWIAGSPERFYTGKVK